MTDPDPYVAPPAEPRPTPRLVGLRPWLLLAIVVLLAGSALARSAVASREDPTLEIPAEVELDPSTGEVLDPSADEVPDPPPLEVPAPPTAGG